MVKITVNVGISGNQGLRQDRNREIQCLDERRKGVRTESWETPVFEVVVSNLLASLEEWFWATRKIH